ncbi:hypothetical protein EMCRGX_G008748 [Ephydatia muelleri]
MTTSEDIWYVTMTTSEDIRYVLFIVVSVNLDGGVKAAVIIVDVVAVVTGCSVITLRSHDYKNIRYYVLFIVVAVTLSGGRTDMGGNPTKCGKCGNDPCTCSSRREHVVYRQPDQPSFDPATPLYGGDMTFSTGREATGAMSK